jgi:hypothetical protein
MRVSGDVNDDYGSQPNQAEPAARAVKGLAPTQETVLQTVGHDFYRQSGQDQTHQSGHHVDAGFAHHPRDRSSHGKAQCGR